MFLSPREAANCSFAFSSPAQSNPSRFFPALEAPADTMLAARADEELTRRIAARLQRETDDACRDWQGMTGPQRAIHRRYASKTLRDYREARARAHAARKVLFKMFYAASGKEMAA
jgi:hypothetical protein